MTSYPRIPAPPTRLDEEPARYYGGRLLLHIMQTGTCAGIGDQELALADHAAVYAVAARDRLTVVYARISEVRTWIAVLLRERAQERAGTEAPSIPSAAPRPKQGPMAPLESAPLSRPPAGHVVTIDF